MKESFKPVFDALAQAGYKEKLENEAGSPIDFKFTPYSLNTKLSFRFDNADDFFEFLQSSGNELTEEKKSLIQAAIVELGLNPAEYFWVNFYEAGKDQEM